MDYDFTKRYFPFCSLTQTKLRTTNIYLYKHYQISYPIVMLVNIHVECGASARARQQRGAGGGGTRLKAQGPAEGARVPVSTASAVARYHIYFMHLFVNQRPTRGFARLILLLYYSQIIQNLYMTYRLLYYLDV